MPGRNGIYQEFTSPPFLDKQAKAVAKVLLENEAWVSQVTVEDPADW